jgi:endonuclease YncB( thermonuclease family)
MARILLVALLAFAKPERELHELAGEVVAISDGDTLTVLDADKVQHKVRLAGIDAPEKGQAFGTAARQALADKVHRERVRVVWREKDRYGRILGDVHLAEGANDRHINREMVADGFAWWYKKYAPKDRELEEAETEARKEGRGLWKDKDPVAPWEWRKEKRERKIATDAAPNT